MKKVLIFLLILFSLPYFIFSEEKSKLESSQIIYGFVRSSTYLGIELDSSVLPFNLLDPYAQATTTTTTTATNSTTEGPISGIKIGEWTMMSNTSDFTIDVSYTPLTNALGQEIAYTLYFLFNNNTKAAFTNPTSTPNGIFNKDTFQAAANTDIEGNNTYEIVNQSLYIALNTPLDDIKTDSYSSGTYKSTLTIIMKTT